MITNFDSRAQIHFEMGNFFGGKATQEAVAVEKCSLQLAVEDNSTLVKLRTTSHCGHPDN
jgi:hypothetical protein